MSDLTEATPLSSPSADDTSEMLGDAAYTRGDITPIETGSGEVSETEFTDSFIYTEFNTGLKTFEGSGSVDNMDVDDLSTTVSEITESDVTEETVEGSTSDSTDESTLESVTQETTASGGKSTRFRF